jgi:hypothetical protein
MSLDVDEGTGSSSDMSSSSSLFLGMFGATFSPDMDRVCPFEFEKV